MRFSAVASVRDADHAAEVQVTGELCPYSAPALRALLDGLVHDGLQRVVIDLRTLRLCTSHGLDVFDEIHDSLRSAGGGLTLAGARGAVQRVFDIVGMPHDDTGTLLPV